MDRAANGLEAMGTAAVEAVDLARHTMPQWFELAERATVALERVAAALPADDEQREAILASIVETMSDADE